MLTQEAINTLSQLTLTLVICGAAWVVFGRKNAALREWLGLISAPSGWWKKSLLLWLLVYVISVPLFHFGPLAELATAEGTVGGRLVEAGMSGETVGVILLMALIKTALTEELFFRGLIAKRLINRFGFAAGNMAQALIFGAVHLAILAVPGAPPATVLTISGMFLLPMFAGWLMGYANERYGNGSILPGWLIHAAGNLVSYITFAI